EDARPGRTETGVRAARRRPHRSLGRHREALAIRLAFPLSRRQVFSRTNRSGRSPARGRTASGCGGRPARVPVRRLKEPEAGYNIRIGTTLLVEKGLDDLPLVGNRKAQT